MILISEGTNIIMPYSNGKITKVKSVQDVQILPPNCEDDLHISHKRHTKYQNSRWNTFFPKLWYIVTRLNFIAKVKKGA